MIHPFTGVDYVDFYKGIIEDAGAQAEIVFANRVQTVLDYTDTVICCDIHTRQRSKRLLKKAGARVVLGLDDLLTAPVNGSGYNPQYGLLGSNKADDTRVKLFPRDADVVAEAIGQRLSEATGKQHRGHGLRRRRLQGSRGQDLGAGGSRGLPRLYRRSGGYTQ